MDLLELALLRRGRRPREGVDHLVRLVTLCEASFGEESLEAVAARHQLALAQLVAGEHVTAAQALERGIASYYRHSMQHGCLLASMHLALGVALHTQGRLERAEESYLHAADLCQEHLGRDDPAAASAHSNLGRLHLDAGNLDQAKAAFGRAVKLMQCVMGVRPLKIKLAGVNLCLAECHAREGGWEEALQSRAKALEIYERLCGAADERTVGARVDVAQCYVRLRDPNRALGQLLKARAACAAQMADGAQVALARTSRLLVCVLCALGRFADAAAELRGSGIPDAEAEQMLAAVDVLAASKSSW